jgi:hydroxyacylglutathione hydrolase
VTNKAAFIDPGEPGPVIQANKDLGTKADLVLITHKHNDHQGGNEAVMQAFPDIKIVGTGYEEIRYATQAVKEGDAIILGSLKIEVIHTPCHTKGHVAYFVTSNECRSERKCPYPLFWGYFIRRRMRKILRRNCDRNVE